MAFFNHSSSTITRRFHRPSIPSNPFRKLFHLNPPKGFLFYSPLCLPQKLSSSLSLSLTTDDQQQFLEAVLAESNEEILPGIRTYEDNSARLTLIGAVDFQQALTAAAADGGRAADEHILAGVQAMVVETIFPGPPDENCTLSTRLFLPARKVKEKVKNLKGFMDDDFISSVASENILAMTFRQVLLQQLWRYELVSFRPGTERNMDDLEKPREVPTMFTISSSNEDAITLLAEVIYSLALSSNRALTKSFDWFHKPKKFSSKDSSVIVYKLLEKEIVANAKTLLGSFTSERIESLGFKSNNSWWALPSNSQLVKIGGPEFSAWISEYVPFYRLLIDVDKFKDLKVEGGKFSATNIWEVLLTHSQMVSLANILDMYYEDAFTLPTKQLSSDVVMKLSKRNKGSSYFLKMLSAAIAGCLFVVTLGIVSQLQLGSLPRGRKIFNTDHPLQSSSVRSIQPESLGDMKFEDCCTSVIRKLKDSFGWPGEIRTEAGRYAWTGDLPYIKRMVESGSMTISSSDTLLGERFEDIKRSIQDIASYQVILSGDGRIVGFLPANRVAVNHWASNPLAKELYAGRNLSPGLIEPGLKIYQSNEVVMLELLTSANSETHFAFVRPVEISGKI